MARFSAHGIEEQRDPLQPSFSIGPGGNQLRLVPGLGVQDLQQGTEMLLDRKCGRAALGWRPEIPAGTVDSGHRCGNLLNARR